MKWQHCGRLVDHAEHKHTARQMVVVEICVCDEERCICPDSEPRVAGRREKFTCPGKQVRSTEIPVKAEVSV